MSKAIMVIPEMPNTCEECPCLFDNGTYEEGHYCEPMDKIVNRNVWNAGRKPYWCPLRELPDKQGTHDGIDYDEGFAEGWNGFREEILRDHDDEKMDEFKRWANGNLRTEEGQDE